MRDSHFQPPVALAPIFGKPPSPALASSSLLPNRTPVESNLGSSPTIDPRSINQQSNIYIFHIHGPEIALEALSSVIPPRCWYPAFLHDITDRILPRWVKIELSSLFSSSFVPSKRVAIARLSRATSFQLAVLLAGLCSQWQGALALSLALPCRFWVLGFPRPDPKGP